MLDFFVSPIPCFPRVSGGFCRFLVGIQPVVDLSKYIRCSQALYAVYKILQDQRCFTMTESFNGAAGTLHQDGNEPCNTKLHG